MMFKMTLWSILTFFDSGSVIQLSFALVTNVLHLCIHVYARPFGGKQALQQNFAEFFTLLLTAFINFGGVVLISLNFSSIANTQGSHIEQEQIDAVKNVLEVLKCNLLKMMIGYIQTYKI